MPLTSELFKGQLSLCNTYSFNEEWEPAGVGNLSRRSQYLMYKTSDSESVELATD